MADHPTDPKLLSQLDDIQANVLMGHAWKHARYHLLRIDDAARFRRALAAALEASPLPSAADFRSPARRPDRALNVAFSHAGLRALGVAQPFLESFPEDFREGMAARADRLGDDGESAPENWQRWLGTPEVHVLIALFFAEPLDFEAAWRDFVDGGGAGVAEDGGEPGLAGSRHLLTEKGDQLFDAQGAVKEHFGFRDGIGQPALADGLTSPEGGGWVDEDGSWRPIATGEFLLGHPDTDGFDPLDGEPALRPLCHNGSYLVFRKLRQHVEGFQKFLSDNFDADKRELAAARMVGRWKNGTPLVQKSTRPGRARSKTSPNDFVYAEDPEGARCPLSAHIRRVNPRDVHRDRNTDPKAVARRRIIRRGFAYGSPDDADKGLLFACFNSRIDSQFEFLQEEWINRGDFIGESSKAKDPLVGAHDAKGDPALLDTGKPRPASIPRFVTTRGGEYFLLPGVKAVGDLLRGRYGTQPMPLPHSAPRRGATDPVRHPEHLDVARLHQTREVESLRVDGIGLDGTRRQRSWHYLVGYDQVLEVLDGESRFTVDHNALRLYELLRDPDREDQPEFETQMLLGLPGGHPEKERRLGMLRDALGVGAPASGSFEGLSRKIEALASQVTGAVIQQNDASHLDVAQSLARAVPVARVHAVYGIAPPADTSELQKAWHFRQLLDPDREWLARARRVLASEGKARAPGLERGLRFETLGWTFPEKPGGPRARGARELAFLARFAALELLIDAYDTGELFDIGRLAMRDLLAHIGARVDEAVSEGPPPDTLLAALLARAPADAGRGDYLTRVKLLLLELVVGGIETPAKGITNTIDGLLRYPQAMQAARQAIEDSEPAALDAVIHELLRLDPVAFLLFRECPKGARLASASGFEIEPGSRVVCVLSHAYRDPQAFEKDPSAFVADRGRREDDPSFGRAPHECIGEQIAMAEIRGVVRALLGSYELQRVPGRAGTKQERFRLSQSLGIKLFPRR